MPLVFCSHFDKLLSFYFYKVNKVLKVFFKIAPEICKNFTSSFQHWTLQFAVYLRLNWRYCSISAFSNNECDSILSYFEINKWWTTLCLNLTMFSLNKICLEIGVHCHGSKLNAYISMHLQHLVGIMFTIFFSILL